MIIQTVDVISRDDPPWDNASSDRALIGGFSNNRFFNDRILRVTEAWPVVARPTLPGTVYPERYVLCFKLNSATAFSALRFWLHNGSIESVSKGVDVGAMQGSDLAAVNVRDNTGRLMFVSFSVRGSWWLRLGTETGWHSCPAVFDAMGLIKTSRPTDDETLSLPRFTSGVRTGWNVLGGDSRGSVGQPYGRTINRLRTYAVEYRRVHADVIDGYFGRVSTTVPHWIVPYPEDVEHVPPIWGTLATPPDMRKRAVNDWYWDLRLTWQEAY